MRSTNTAAIEETRRLNEKNAALRRQLNEALETIRVIKSGNIDALVVSEKKGIKVYSERTSDQVYRLLIEKMHEGAVTLDHDGVILYCNSCFAAMVKLPLQKVIGTYLVDFIRDSSKKRFDAILRDSLENVEKKEVEIYASDKKAVPVLISVNTLKIENESVVSIILTDITIQNSNQEKLRARAVQLEQKNKELKNAYHELALQNKEKEKRAEELHIANQEIIFQMEEKAKRAAELISARTDVKERDELIAHKESILAMLSHDLRSPLAGIIGISEHLRARFDTMEKETVKEFLNHLYKAATDELNMLDYLVEWARIKYASEAFAPVKIKLVDHVNQVFELLEEAAGLRAISLHQEIEENEQVFADSKMLLSILQNIVSNAIKHSREGGQVSVIAKKLDNIVLVEIKDTGIGMSKEILQKLFTPQMNTLSKARKENTGAGIGLLLVKGFLEKNGGKIWVESTEGVGSSFYFTLPANKPSDNMNGEEK